jgi:hypothetical protein
MLRPRSDIEEEIQKRQEHWRQGEPGSLPPPTNTGGSSPPPLPSTPTGGDDEPPPISYVPSTLPDEKPPGGSNQASPRQEGAQSMTATDDQGEGRGSQTGKITPFPTQLQKRRENEGATSLESFHTTPDEPIPSRLSPAPDQQPRQTSALEFVSLELFESTSREIAVNARRWCVPPLRQREVRYVGCELVMRNRLHRQRSERYAFQIRYYNPDGYNVPRKLDRSLR